MDNAIWKDSYIVRNKIRTDPKEAMMIKRIAKKNKLIMQEFESKRKEKEK